MWSMRWIAAFASLLLSGLAAGVVVTRPGACRLAQPEQAAIAHAMAASRLLADVRGRSFGMIERGWGSGRRFDPQRLAGRARRPSVWRLQPGHERVLILPGTALFRVVLVRMMSESDSLPQIVVDRFV